MINDNYVGKIIERMKLNHLEILKETLKDMIPIELYSIGGYREESFCLEKRDKEWIVYVGERGNKHDIKSFNNVKEACGELISRVSESDEKEKFIKYLFEFNLTGRQWLSTTNTKDINSVPAFSKLDAISMIKYYGTFAQMDNLINAHINIGTSDKQYERQVSGVVVLPNRINENNVIVVFAKDNKIIEARNAGADYVGGEEIVSKIEKDGWLDFDAVVATPDMMKVVGRLNNILGPKGLMPNHKYGTVTMDVTKAVQNIRAGKIEYQLDRSNFVHVPVGKVSFTEEALQQNFDALIESIVKTKPEIPKTKYIKNVILSSDENFAVKVNLSTIESVSQEVYN